MRLPKFTAKPYFPTTAASAPAAPAAAETSISEMTVSAASVVIEGFTNLDQVTEAWNTEVEGKNRKGVLDALESKEEELKA